jgi:meiotically up-regulated gene 157 (Mug157) protein
VRPLKKERKFVSQVLDDFIRNTKANMTDRDLSILLENCLPNTLDTTVEWINDDKKNPSTFLITGDSNAKKKKLIVDGNRCN